MLSLLHCIRSDLYKFRHTSMILIHLILPLGAAAAFLAYFAISPWKPGSKVSGYFEMIGVSFPLVIGLVCSKTIEQEGQAGSFQNMLCGTKSRTVVFLSKLIVMLLLGACSIALAIGVFAAGFRVAPWGVYGKVTALLIAGSIFLYILHLFVSLQYGRGASIGLGIVESLLSALALTGLGDGIWYYIPCTWCARFSDDMVYSWLNPAKSFGFAELKRGLLVAVPATLIALILVFLWFRIWEGRKTYD